MLSPILNIHSSVIDYNQIFKLGINVDWFPMANSSKNQLWPILISVINNCSSISKYVALVGIFHGLAKSLSVIGFFQPFVDDLSELLESGLYS